MKRVFKGLLSPAKYSLHALKNLDFYVIKEQSRYTKYL
jgi:hypothetical protein